MINGLVKHAIFGPHVGHVGGKLLENILLHDTWELISLKVGCAIFKHMVLQVLPEWV
jgi:hypothetical protein